jgi:hypothetical protein
MYRGLLIRPRPATLYWKVSKRAQREQMISGKLNCFCACGSSKGAELPRQAYLGLAGLHTSEGNAVCHGSWVCLLVRGEPESSEIAKGLSRTTVELVFLLGLPTLRSRGGPAGCRLPECRVALIGGRIVFFSSLPKSSSHPNIVPQERLRYLAIFRS